MRKQMIEKRKFATTEYMALSHAVLINRMFIIAPISNKTVPMPNIARNEIFLSDTELKNNVEISISTKNVKMKSRFINTTNVSLNKQTRIYENLPDALMQSEF